MSEAQAPPWTSRQAGRPRPQGHADWSRPMPQANQVPRRRAPGLPLQYRTSEAVRTTYLYRGNKTARHLFGICRFQCARTMIFRCRMPVSMPMRLSMSIFSYILFKCYLSFSAWTSTVFQRCHPYRKPCKVNQRESSKQI